MFEIFCLKSLPEYPHDSEYLSNPPHLILILVTPPTHHLVFPTNTGAGQQTEDERGEVWEDSQQVYDVHTTLDKPNNAENILAFACEACIAGIES